MLWHLKGGRRLRTEARAAVEGAVELNFSVVSFAEIGVKVAIGKLSVPADIHDRILALGVRILGLSADHGLDVSRLPMHHRDPFDRLLIAQARAERLTVLTADSRFPEYPIKTVVA